MTDGHLLSYQSCVIAAYKRKGIFCLSNDDTLLYASRSSTESYRGEFADPWRRDGGGRAGWGTARRPGNYGLVVRQPGLLPGGGENQVLHGDHDHHSRSRNEGNHQSVHTYLTSLHVLLPWPVFIKQLKSNLYVSRTTIGSFQCYLYSHWLSKKKQLKFLYEYGLFFQIKIPFIRCYACIF